MLNFFGYPHTDLNQGNLDWIVRMIKDLKNKVQSLIDNDQPVKNSKPQLTSYAAHSNVTQRQIAVLDKDGNIFGDSININDIMLKPRRCASGAIGVFDDHGNLLPTSLDERTPLITLAKLAVYQTIDTAASGARDTFQQLMSGLHIETGTFSLSLHTFNSAGSLYRKNENIGVTFETEFDRVPIVILGSCTDLDNPVIIGGLRVSQTGIERGSFFSYQQFTAATPLNITVPYMAIGFTEVHTHDH